MCLQAKFLQLFSLFNKQTQNTTEHLLNSRSLFFRTIYCKSLIHKVRCRRSLVFFCLCLIGHFSACLSSLCCRFATFYLHYISGKKMFLCQHISDNMHICADTKMPDSIDQFDKVNTRTNFTFFSLHRYRLLRTKSRL